MFMFTLFSNTFSKLYLYYYTTILFLYTSSILRLCFFLGQDQILNSIWSVYLLTFVFCEYRLNGLRNRFQNATLFFNPLILPGDKKWAGSENEKCRYFHPKFGVSYEFLRVLEIDINFTIVTTGRPKKILGNR